MKLKEFIQRKQFLPHRSAIQPWLVTSVEGCHPAEGVNGQYAASTGKVDVVERGLGRLLCEPPLKMISGHHSKRILNGHGQFVLWRDQG